ncbi:MAG: Transporter, LysE family [Pseudolabrys sp.]|jgi:threonine/homoserine/homoserine lactone efflux protein|nr:Transporter, LysE family [Pseudolabrys sp.]
MPFDVLLALTVFAVIMAFTPGPNNILLTASGVNFGFTRTIPHLLGVDIGFVVLLAAFAAGLGVVFAAVPALQLALKVAGAAYMLYLAWKVGTAKLKEEATETPGRPMTFLQAVAFQWVNPKAVVAALSGIAVYMRPGHERYDFAIVLVVFAVATVLSTATWAGFGVALRRLLCEPRHARMFNIAMAILLAATVIPIVV